MYAISVYEKRFGHLDSFCKFLTKCISKNPCIARKSQRGWVFLTSTVYACNCAHTYVCPRVSTTWIMRFRVLRVAQALLMSPITPACGHILWDLHAEGLIVWSQSLRPLSLSSPSNPTHHVWEAPVSQAVRLRGTPASQENGIVTPERHTHSLLRRQICVKLKCRFFILSALHRGLTFLKLLACDKSISAAVKRHPSWCGDLICK